MMRASVMAGAPRMSLSALNVMEDSDRQVRIWLLGSTTIKGTVFYRIAGRFNASGQTWQVNRRFSEFLVLRESLIKYFSRTPDTCPGCLNYLHAIKQFDFPKKHLFVSKSQLVVNYRIQALRSFMNLLASWAFSNSPKCPTCGGFAFDIVRNFCLESAEAVGESNMSYIRDSFVVSTFTDAGRRSSLSRRNSLVPGSTPNSQRRSDLHHRNTMSDAHPSDRHGRGDGNAYDAFNDYLIRQPSQQAKAAQSRASINVPQSRGTDDRQAEQERAAGGSSRGSRAHAPHRSSSTGAAGHGRTLPPQQPGSTAEPPSFTNGSFLFYQDGVERGTSTASSQRASTTNGASANGSQRGAVPAATGSKRGILKNWNDVRRDRDRQQNDSYLSVEATSSASHEAHDSANGRPSSSRGSRKNRHDARSDTDSYFSLGASSANSRDENDYPQPASQRGPKASDYSNGYGARPQQQPQDVRYDRSQNDSYLSLGASSTSGDLEDEYHSHHPSVLPSPSHLDALYAQPPPTQKYVGHGSSKKTQQVRSPPPSSSSQRQSQRARSPPPSHQRQSQRLRSPPPSLQRQSQRSRGVYSDEEEEDQPRSSRRHPQRPPAAYYPEKKAPVLADESFATDSFVDESLRFDGMGPVAVDDVSDSDDEIDVTGLAIDSPPKPRKSTSGQNLWQPWELAKAG